MTARCEYYLRSEPGCREEKINGPKCDVPQMGNKARARGRRVVRLNQKKGAGKRLCEVDGGRATECGRDARVDVQALLV